MYLRKLKLTNTFHSFTINNMYNIYIFIAISDIINSYFRFQISFSPNIL